MCYVGYVVGAGSGEEAEVMIETGDQMDTIQILLKHYSVLFLRLIRDL